MGASTKIAYSRLLYADFISDENEEKEITSKINGFGFTASPNESNAPAKFSIGDIGNFVGQLRSMCKSDSELLDYVSNIFFWIYADGILPLRVAIIEVILKTEDLQKLNKSDLEGKIWKLSLLLGSCFIEGSIPTPNCSEDFRILKFSSKVVPNLTLRNFVADFVIGAESKFFDDFNKELDSLEKQIAIKDLIEQKIIDARDNGKIPASKVGKIISNTTAQSEQQKIKDTRNNIISLEPVSFLEGGFSYDQSIVRGYANEMFIIGKIVQGLLGDSTPLYLVVMSLGLSEMPSSSLELPVLQLPGRTPLLNFSFGAGEILALQLLNSWNRYIEMSIMEVTTKQNLAQTKAKTDANETLEELRVLITHRGINEKISVNYRGALQDLANPSKKTFLYELPIPPREDTPYSTNPEKYGLEKPGPIVSNFATLILKNLDLNEKHLLDATALRRAKIDVLKIEEDIKYSRQMLCLTVIIALATVVNVVVFILRLF